MLNVPIQKGTTMNSRILTLGIALLASIALIGQASALCSGPVSDSNSDCMSASFSGNSVTVENDCDHRIMTEVSLNTGGDTPTDKVANIWVDGDSEESWTYSQHPDGTISAVNCCSGYAACSSAPAGTASGSDSG